MTPRPPASPPARSRRRCSRSSHPPSCPSSRGEAAPRERTTISPWTLVDGVAKRATDFRAFAEMVAMADGCNPKGGYKWQWSIESSDPAFKMQLDRSAAGIRD